MLKPDNGNMMTRWRLLTQKVSAESTSVNKLDFHNRIDWDDVKLLKSESHGYRHRLAESFLINQKALSLNGICNDGANFPVVNSVFTANK